MVWQVAACRPTSPGVQEICRPSAKDKNYDEQRPKECIDVPGKTCQTFFLSVNRAMVMIPIVNTPLSRYYLSFPDASRDKHSIPML